MSERTLRIGAVSYLNSKPLVEGLHQLLPNAGIRLDFPSRLADDLAEGELDVALIPSIEYFRGQDYRIISNACVAAHGPVLSVKLYSRVPWGEIRTLALDEGSRTSATLARVLLAERHGVVPQLEPLPLDHRTEETKADAVLLIGDRAILPPSERFRETWDLGQEWFEWTGLPFVFAMWVAKIGHVSTGRAGEKQAASTFVAGTKTASDFVPALEAHELPSFQLALGQARDAGVRRLEEIALREAPLLGLSVETTFNYLSKNLHYDLGNAERNGLSLFYELASGLGLAPAGVTLRFGSAANAIS
jgi:chorismate dehydratase